MTMAAARRLYLASCAVVFAAFFAAPVTRVASPALLGALSAAAIVYGVRYRRPARRGGWILLAVAVGLLSIGGIALNVEVLRFSRPPPFPAVPDAFFLACYIPLILGLLELGRPRRPIRDWVVVLDTVALGVAGSLPVWLLLIRPAVMSLNLSAFDRVLALASWLGFVTVLAAAVRVVLVWRTNVALNFVAAGALAFLIGDYVYGRNLIDGTWHHVVLIDLGYGLFVVLCGAAALSESMLMLDSDDGQAQHHLGSRQIVVVGVALLIPPTILLVEAVPGPVTTGVAIGLVAVTVGAIVVVRLVVALRANRRRARREHAMRIAVRELVEATTNTEVCDSLQTALTAMLPMRSDGEVHLRPRKSAGLSRTGSEMESLVVPVTGSTVPASPGSSLDLVFTAPRECLPELQSSLLDLSDQAVAALDRIELNRRLRSEEKERYFRTLVLTSADATLISRDGRIDYATPSAQTIFGREVQGERFDDVVRRASSDDAPNDDAPDDRPWSTAENAVEGYVVHPDGERIAVLVHRRDLTDDPTVNGVVATVRDVTAELRLKEDLAYRATHDALTGLANAKAFGDELRGEAARRRERRIAAPAGIAALFIDLDDFKDVNDTYGHQVGDQLLGQVAQRISDCLREGDIAARLGGDEFAALLRGLPGEAAAQSIAQRMVDALAQPVLVGGIPLNGEASVGLAYAPKGSDLEELIRNADTALYNAKAHGKGRWRQYHEGMVNPTRHHVDARRRVQAALDNGWLAVHYQPIVELATGVPVGFEALVRVNDPRASLAPAELIAIAEQTGLIERVGEFVLRQALMDARQLTGGDERYISVNLSARQLRQPDFVAKVRSHLAAAHTDPTCLVLEITENVLVADDDRAWSYLAALRADGVRIAIDDYGTGYASLSYLRQPVIDIVKVDRTFLADEPSERNLRLLRAVNALCADLGLEAIAEGVHDDASRAALLSVGYQYGQGFLYSTALPLDEALRWTARAPRHTGPRAQSSR